jgi:hypothetical protein
MHVAPLDRVSLGPKSEYRFRYWLIVGAEAQIARRLDELWKKYSEERARLSDNSLDPPSDAVPDSKNKAARE